MGTKKNNLRQHFSGAAKPDYFLSVISEQVNFILKKRDPLPHYENRMVHALKLMINDYGLICTYCSQVEIYLFEKNIKSFSQVGDAKVANLTELRSISFESISTTITTLQLMSFQVILSIQTCLIYIEMQNWQSRNTNYCIPVFIYIRIFKDITNKICFSEIVYLFNIF